MIEYSEETNIYVLMTKDKNFVGIIDFDSGKRFNFGFTTVKKAKEFLRIVHKNNQLKNVERLYPCTIGEYLQIQEKDPEFPFVAIDTSPEDFRNYPFMIGDASKENIRVFKFDKPDSRSYSILTTSRKQQ